MFRIINILIVGDKRLMSH